MKKYKDKIKLVNMLLYALYKLKAAKLEHIQNQLADFSSKCSEVTKSSNIFNAAVNKGWFRSAEKIRQKTSRNLSDFSHHLNQFKNIINSDESKLQTPSDIYSDIKQLEEEYGDLKINLKERTLSIITEPVVLDEIHFGPFEIRLFIDEIAKLYSDSPYKVIALEPNYAGSDSDVTHPHVSHEKLCEGDGHMPIRKSIEQGRFCDLFTLVVNILQNYNPDSPYVSLDDWDGISCYDCGYTISNEDCYFCEECENDFCSQCSSYCQICDTTICLGCSYECPSCNQPVCRHCTAVCAECEETICKDCIGEDSLCKHCLEQRKEDEYEEEQIPETQPAIQSNSLGQTPVHA